MFCSIFVGAISAENVSVDLSDNPILNETGNLETFNSSDNYSLSSEIDGFFDADKTEPLTYQVNDRAVLLKRFIAASGRRWLWLY